MAFLEHAYDLSLERMIADVANSRIPGTVIPCTEDAMRARLISWRTSDHYIKGATSRDMGTHGEAQRLSRRAVARGLDPAVVHDLIRHHPTTDIEDIFKVAEALERATPN